MYENTRFSALGEISFVNVDTFVNGGRKYVSRINVTTGEVAGDGWQTANEVSYQPVKGTSGFSLRQFASG